MSTKAFHQAVLHLIPTPLGENPPIEVLPISIKKTLEDLDHFIVENEKMGRRFIKKIAPNKNQNDLRLNVLNKFTTQEELVNYLNPCLEGHSMGLLSDAGCPGVADPGAVIVSKAHQLGIKVKPHVGPSSILLALMSSGMNGQSFAFNGYLPIDKKQRTQALLKYQRLSLKEKQTQIFIETPYRNEVLLQEILKTLDPNTLLCIACDLSLSTEFIQTASVSNWKKKTVAINKRPAIFLIEGSF